MRRLLLLAAFLCFFPATAGATTDHCPDHDIAVKVEAQGDNLNSIVLEAGTRFCVKGGVSTSGSILTADGETTLRSYLGTGQDVSYYVIYDQIAVIPPSTTTTTAPLAIPPVEVPEVPHNVCPDGNGYTFKTDLPCPEVIGESQTVTRTAGPVIMDELPRTGVDVGFLAFVGFGLGLIGALLWRRAR